MTLSLLKLPLLSLATVGLLAGCSAQPAQEEAPEVAPTPTTEAAPAVPVDQAPQVPREANDACPYLDGQWLAETNGQRLTSQGVDNAFETPACVFYSYPEEPQATVLVRELPNEDYARQVVDWAAPVDSTSPATLGEWEGGRGQVGQDSQGNPGSVFAVSKGNHTVAVWTNQAQSVKAELIAQKAIENLGL